MGANHILSPGDPVVIFGGGQLGMLASEMAARIGRRTMVYAPPGDNPAARTATEFISKSYEDTAELDKLAERIKVATYEFENIPIETLQRLMKKGVRVYPPVSLLSIAQDRRREKELFDSIGVPTPETFFGETGKENPADFVPKNFPFPAILKKARAGYDGKGQVLVHKHEDLQAAWEEIGKVTWVLQEFLSKERLLCEVSVIVGQDTYGSMENFRAIENLHDNGILRVSRCPAPSLSEDMEKRAVHIARAIARTGGLIGILAVELFVLRDGAIFANEIAPRPHNSGHGTIEACEVNQNEMLLRIIAGERIRPPNLLFKFEMRNLLGTEVLKFRNRTLPANVHFWDYHKEELTERRKTGHTTSVWPLPLAT